MPEPLRSQRYEGLFPSQTQEMFDADARDAAQHDWYPKSEKWTGATLFVEYEHDPGRSARIAAATAAAATPLSKGKARDTGPAVDPDHDPVSGRRRRVMIGLGVAIAVVAVVAVTMVGAQLLSRPAGGTAQTVGDPGATPAPAAAAALSSPLGARATAVEYFRELGYSGVLAPLVDGRDRWRATDKRASVAEVIGPEDRITEVSLTVRLLRDEKRDNKARSEDLGLMFEGFAPYAAQWATDELEQTEPTMARTSEQQFGDVLVRLVSMPVKGGAAVKFQIITE